MAGTTCIGLDSWYLQGIMYQAQCLLSSSPFPSARPSFLVVAVVTSVFAYAAASAGSRHGGSGHVECVWGGGDDTRLARRKQMRGMMSTSIKYPVRTVSRALVVLNYISRWLKWLVTNFFWPKSCILLTLGFASRFVLERPLLFSYSSDNTFLSNSGNIDKGSGVRV